MTPQKTAFVLANTTHGSMIVNRLDYNVEEGRGYGVGFNLLEAGAFDYQDVVLLKLLLDWRRKLHGDGVVAFDGGANIGVHTLEWARHMRGWGSVIAVEAQERVFYALAGNIALNNCFNARALLAALSDTEEPLHIPVLDYTKPASFGSLELKAGSFQEFIGQPIDYSRENSVETRAVTIDSFKFGRLDLLKIDVEGMELDVLNGARNTIKACRPLMFIEHIKIDRSALIALLAEVDYTFKEFGINLIAFHKDDKVSEFL